MSFFQAACSLSDFAFISWKRSRYLKTIRWFFGWSFCVFLSTGFTLTESSDFAIVASSLLFWDGELGRLLNFGIRLRSSGNKFLSISISRNSFCCLGFSEDSKGSTCQPYFRLFALSNSSWIFTLRCKNFVPRIQHCCLAVNFKLTFNFADNMMRGDWFC